MNRRTYLGLAATGVVGSVAGCTSTASDGSEYPPYPDGETVDLSGTGTGTSDEFELTQEGPTLVDMEHMGSDNFTVVLADPAAAAESEAMPANESMGETNESEPSSNESEPSSNESVESGANETAQPEVDDSVVSSVVTVVGPFDGRTLLSVGTGSYVLRVLEADAEWTATVYDLPAYEDGVGTPLPIKREGTQWDVIGPINFGEQAETTFSFSVTGEGYHRVNVVGRESEKTFRVTALNGDGEDAITRLIDGVGYIVVRSFGSWTFELST